MKRYILTALLFISQIVWSQNQSEYNTSDTINGVYIPKDISECILHIEKYLPRKTKVNTLSTDEISFKKVASKYTSIITQDYWKLADSSRLAEYFHKRNIYHPNVMYDIVLTSYYRNFNNQPIRLKDQVRAHSININKAKRGNPSLDFSAYSLKRKAEYKSLESALEHRDSVDYIALSECHILPKKIKRFKHINEFDIYDSPHINYEHTFKILSKLKNLEELYFDNNNAQYIPENISLLKNLKYIDFTLEHFVTLPNSFKELRKLEELIIRQCYNADITELISTVSFMPNITTLDLTENNMQSLPSSISKLQWLEDLTLDDNKLKHIPKEVKQLPNLEWLSITNNQIDSIHLESSDFPKLKYLYIGENQLTIFPVHLHKLKHLKHLSIYNIKRLKFPDQMELMSHLESLNLQGCYLTGKDRAYLKQALPNTKLIF